MRILMTGGTGFIGKACAKFLAAQEHEIIILTKNKKKAPLYAKVICDTDEIANEEKIDIIINLAGSPIDKKWNEKHKEEIFNSRINTTSTIIELIKRLKTKPQLLISASTICFQDSQENTTITDDSSEETRFIDELCQAWEDEAKKAAELGVRLCIARLGVVLGKSGGRIKKIFPSFRSGLGKRIDDGSQYISWVHLFDTVRAFNFFIKKQSCSGIYNVTAPNPVTNEKFTITMNDVLHLPTILFIPGFLIKILYGEMGETLLLNSYNIPPNKLLDEGFRFEFNTIEEALTQILKKKKKF